MMLNGSFVVLAIAYLRQRETALHEANTNTACKCLISNGLQAHFLESMSIMAWNAWKPSVQGSDIA
jgi:hypothetical protein